MNLVESVIGLQGLKAALASNFVADPSVLPDNFRRGYIVDLDQHWISVHASFQKRSTSNLLSLIVFDTLEVNYQRFYEVGLLRSHSAEMGLARAMSGNAPSVSSDGLDVLTVCKMRDIQYEISFLAPICDMRRLTWEEENEIRMEKKSAASKASTVYYDQSGNPFRKIIVQPILQAEQDGTCKSRSLAALGWLLSLDNKALDWYVVSNRELFQAEVRAIQGRVARQNHNFIGDGVEEDAEKDAEFGSLMSTGQRDKFGRDVHMKVCHVDTVRYNEDVEESFARPEHRRASTECCDALLPSGSREMQLRRQREAEVDRIREVHLQGTESTGQSIPRTLGLVADVSYADEPTTRFQRWRGIEDHEARWHFLEETCFFGHNIGFKKIKKLYSRDELLPKAMPPVGAFDASADNTTGTAAAFEDNCGFGETKYLRKYILGSNKYITHEADPVFYQPLENFFGFLCGNKQAKTVLVPFYVLPFPACFVALSLEDGAQSTSLALDMHSEQHEHRTQKVSDFVLPAGDNFLNDPIAYNKCISNVSRPVKVTV